MLTVGGASFAPSDMTQAGRLGASACATTTWASITSAACHASPANAAAWTAVPVALTVMAAVGTKLSALTFDGPSLSAFKCLFV